MEEKKKKNKVVPLLPHFHFPMPSLEPKPHFDEHSYNLYRDLGWLLFNERVLSEAESENVPLMERLKFCVIFSSNLDEFFMVRLSSLLEVVERFYQEKMEKRGIFDQETVIDSSLIQISQKVEELTARLSWCLHHDLLPQLKKGKLEIVTSLSELKAWEREEVDTYFQEQIFPVLTPLAIDSAHPFPYLTNLSLYLAVTFEEKAEMTGEHLLAFLEIPQKLDRFICLQHMPPRYKFIPIEEIIKAHIEKFFPWTKVKGVYIFRITRNLDYDLMENEVKNLMESIQIELKDREQKSVIRMEYEEKMPWDLVERLAARLDLDKTALYQCRGLMNIREFAKIVSLEVLPEWRDPVFNPSPLDLFEDKKLDIFGIIKKERSLLLHHPYDAFISLLNFVKQAAVDKDVLAIKQTIYRIGANSPLIESLMMATENGKQVTVVVELKARFDEANNIEWAKRLERAGAHVVYGFVDLKTHAKTTLVMRKEGGKVQRYVHLSTGNYNSQTAKQYTDIGYLTTDETIAADVSHLFNLLTGFSNVFEEKWDENVKEKGFRQLLVAPFNVRDKFLKMIEREIHHAEKGKKALIIIKVNSLIDAHLIHGLYKASQAGVRIELIVRGVCLLLPQVKKLSENIRVTSIIDRFLEHSRIFYFFNNGKEDIYCGSPDWMPRNMDRRIEVCWPVEEKKIKEKIKIIFEAYLSDNCKSHSMQSDGTYSRNNRKDEDKVIFRCQEYFISQSGISNYKKIDLKKKNKLKKIYKKEAI